MPRHAVKKASKWAVQVFLKSKTGERDTLRHIETHVLAKLLFRLISKSSKPNLFFNWNYLYPKKDRIKATDSLKFSWNIMVHIICTLLLMYKKSQIGGVKRSLTLNARRSGLKFSSVNHWALMQMSLGKLCHIPHIHCHCILQDCCQNKIKLNGI